MKHPPCRFAAPGGRQRRLLFGHVQACTGRLGAAALSPFLSPSAWRGAHPEAWRSQFLGCPRMACSAAIGCLGLLSFYAAGAIYSAQGN